MSTIGHFIHGEHVADNNQPKPVTNPATGQLIHEVAMASVATVETAINSAYDAFPAWRDTTPLNRARVMFNFKALIERDADDIVALITEEHGKVKSDAAGELTRGLEIVEFATGIPHLQKGEHSSQVGRGIDSWSEMQPLGVVAGITPFNFPAMVPMWMFPIAIASGNSFVLKPSEKNPSVALKLADLLKEAGLPDGVFNVVNGDKVAVDTLLTHPKVEAVSFVGSTPIAEYIYATASAHGKRVQALGGAKNHMVIMPDADVDSAANALMGAAYGSAGERCMAISVAVCVGDEAAEELKAKLLPKIEAMTVGNGVNDPDMGPLVSADHYAKVRSYVDLGVEEGADLIVDGRDLSIAGYEDGFFLGACLFDNVTDEMRIYQEEIFGPVLCIVRVPDFETACRLINDHEYGNGTTIFTRNGDTARKFTHYIQVGMVGVNVPIPVPMAFHSFGGWKRSLFGPLHMHGKDGVRFYTKMKTITQRWPSDMPSVAEFSMPTLK
jgi:malonate-semialdehyde dehydrogenase (acetylating)/methylmalonate-semialdehyde dehydrogenase